jgi:ABC-type enterochelin transport system ATPase subunit
MKLIKRLSAGMAVATLHDFAFAYTHKVVASKNGVAVVAESVRLTEKTSGSLRSIQESLPT